MNHWRVATAFLTLLWGVSFCVFFGPYSYILGFQSKTNDCFFLFHAPFFFEFWDHPAALIRYGGRFLSQFFHYRWLGALIVAGAVTCFGLLFYRLLKKGAGIVPASQVLFPCLLLLLMHTSTLWLLQDTLGLCAVVACLLGYLYVPGARLKYSYALAATAILYLTAGFYVWFFCIWIVLSEAWGVADRLRWARLTSYFLFSVSLPLLAWRWLFPVPLASAWLSPLLFTPPFRTGSPQQSSPSLTADGILAALLAVLLLLIPFWRRFFQDTRLAGFWHLTSDRRGRIVLVGTVAVLGFLVHVWRYDAPLAKVVACRDLYEQRAWERLLDEAKENPYNDHRVQFMTNFALCQQGRLLDDMFRYPQPCGTRGLFLRFSGQQTTDSKGDATFEGMYNSDLLYDMGHANYAFRHAYNKMCLYGRTAETMMRVAQCSMVNGNQKLRYSVYPAESKGLWNPR